MLIYEIPFSGKWISTKTTVHYIKKDSRYFTFIYFSFATSRGHWWKYFHCVLKIVPYVEFVKKRFLLCTQKCQLTFLSTVPRSHPPDPPTSPSVCRALRRHVPQSFQECRRTGAVSADSEAERHSVGVRPAVRIGEIHCGAMGKPSGINSFKSEESIASQAWNASQRGFIVVML